MGAQIRSLVAVAFDHADIDFSAGATINRVKGFPAGLYALDGLLARHSPTSGWVSDVRYVLMRAHPVRFVDAGHFDFIHHFPLSLPRMGLGTVVGASPYWCFEPGRARFPDTGEAFAGKPGPCGSYTRWATSVNRFKDQDWKRLYQVLLILANCARRRYNAAETFDGGQDCEDVVVEVLATFFSSPDGLGWKESKGKLETYLGAVVRNKLVDRLRRQKHVAGSLDDPDYSAPAKLPAGPSAPERAKPDIKVALYDLVKGDRELEDLIAAAELVDGGPNVNQELGQILNRTPRQVSKLKERLLATDGVKELYAARQATKTTRPRP